MGWRIRKCESYQLVNIPPSWIYGKRIIDKSATKGEQLKSRWEFGILEGKSFRCPNFQLFPREVAMLDITLTDGQEEEAQRLAAIIGKKAQEEALNMARLLASKSDDKLLGATEFEIRERAHKFAATAIETALNERKKGGTVVPASSARTAKTTPVS